MKLKNDIDYPSAPILLFVFNRPDTLQEVFKVIREVKPEVLYLVSDGPRKHVPQEVIKVKKSRDIVSNIDWKCKVIRLYSDKNNGLYKTLWKSLDFIFSRHDRIIFLEDDVVPSISFFRFMNQMLEIYKDDFRIQQIAGMNVLGEYPLTDEFSYFYSKETSIWGFGFWKRVYDSFDRKHLYGKDRILIKQLYNITPKFQFQKILNYTNNGFSDGHRAGLEYFFGLHKYLFHSLAIIPTKNLVANIGCNDDSQHENSFLTLPKTLQKLYFTKTFDFHNPIKVNPFIIDDLHYSRKILYLTGNGHPWISFYRKIIKIIKIIRYEGLKGLKLKITKVVRSKKES